MWLIIIIIIQWYESIIVKNNWGYNASKNMGMAESVTGFVCGAHTNGYWGK